jgi:Flp pilus assembly protein TadD
VESHFGRGVAYRQFGKPKQAAQDFRKALALDAEVETKTRKIGLSR